MNAETLELAALFITWSPVMTVAITKRGFYFILALTVEHIGRLCPVTEDHSQSLRVNRNLYFYLTVHFK